jgi:hypothetical protein
MLVHGVDFSGSAEPGTDIWLVSGRYDPDDDPDGGPERDPDGGPERAPDGGPDVDGGRLRVTAARPASEAFGVTGRDAVLDELGRFLRADLDGTAPGQVTGLDCSFGLPRAVLPPDVAGSDDWRQALDWVREAFPDADGRSFQTTLKERARASSADGVELKRATDGPVGASSPYSFITRYQTLHGLRDLLAPAVAAGVVAVPPMLAPAADGRPAVVESYPAATLRALGLPDRKYKDDARYPEAPARRERILDGLLDRGVALDGVPRERLLADSGGDALDALVAAVAVTRNCPDLAVDRSRYDPIEGYIYV